MVVRHILLQPSSVLLPTTRRKLFEVLRSASADTEQLNTIAVLTNAVERLEAHLTDTSQASIGPSLSDIVRMREQTLGVYF